MIDDSISTSTSTSGGRYGETSSPRTEPGNGILNWRAQIDHHGNTHWLADGPDGKMWRIFPVLKNMATLWVDASDCPLGSRGRLWTLSSEAKADIEREHISIMRFIDARRNAADEGVKDGSVRDQNQAATGSPERMTWRALPNCNGWYLLWDRGDNPFVVNVDYFDCIRIDDSRMWFGPIDDPHRAAK